ncbi:MAG: UDP-N-acetylmuramate--L-alanine ligase [Armatimonadota bacterium]
MNSLNLPVNARVHMVGIGGAGMSGLATVMASMGYRVSGSDMGSRLVLDKLAGLGVAVCRGHHASFTGDADLVVASAAVPYDNPELVVARDNDIPIISRAELLGWMMSCKRGIAVAGTHGKTSTTSMLAVILETAVLDPTIVIGGNLDLIDGNAKLGEGDLLLAEACEAFNSFLELHPNIAVVTNIEADHLDCHGSLEGVINSFRKFLSQVKDGGFAVMCLDCPNTRSIVQDIDCDVITYGTSPDAKCRAYDINTDVPEPTFKVSFNGCFIGEFILNIPGLHNVRNALAAITVGIKLGIAPKLMREALLKFHGAGRRFEILGTSHGITVIDDYAHHPTEVHATLTAAKSLGRRIVAVFQPHLFSRTKLLANEFADNLKLADLLYLTEIYPSREKPMPGVSSMMIIDLMNGCSTDIKFVPEKDKVADEIISDLRNGDLVIVMGAGDIRSAGEALLSKLESMDEGIADK